MKIERISDKQIRYTADEGKWLTSSIVKEGKEHLRAFSQMIYTPYELSLVEFTTEEKDQWKKDHPIHKTQQK